SPARTLGVFAPTWDGSRRQFALLEQLDNDVLGFEVLKSPDEMRHKAANDLSGHLGPLAVLLIPTSSGELLDLAGVCIAETECAVLDSAHPPSPSLDSGASVGLRPPQ